MKQTRLLAGRVFLWTGSVPAWGVSGSHRFSYGRDKHKPCWQKVYTDTVTYKT